MGKQHLTGIVGFALALALLLGGTGAKDVDVIYWGPSYKLSWADFKGQPREEHESVSALTSSGILYYSGCKDGRIVYEVQAYFECRESWVKPEARTDYHLAHEQLHFDITELFARKIEALLDAEEFRCGEEARFEHFVNTMINNWQVKQQAYDLMTRHSLDQAQQHEWEAKIRHELEDFGHDME